MNELEGAENLSIAETTILSPRPLRPPSTLLRAPLQISTIADGPQAPAQPSLQFDQDWDRTLAVRFADYIAYALREYGVPIPGLFTIVYGPTPTPAGSRKKTRDYSIVAPREGGSGSLGQLREDIVRLCIVKCVRELGAGSEVLFSIRLGFPPMPVGGRGTPRTTTLVPRRLWGEDRWDAAVLGDELCAAGVNERVWGHGAWERVCEVGGAGRGIEYEIQRVR
ncbi:hypothetical protein F5B17DRAFT_304187 [Nemania serpens]|nr:hypothetical protein F5B17DRAFT_304187 [Nemania serpens]